MSRYDAIVIGAGPAGATAALRLARAGWRVAVVEKTPFPRRKVCGEFVSAPTLSLLAQLGLGDIAAGAGPDIREVGVYAGRRTVTAAMPPAAGVFAYGRALGRDRLDAALLDAARAAGADVHQPWRVERVMRGAEGYACELAADGQTQTLLAPVVIAAHGSWDTGRLDAPSTRALCGTQADLLAFKAHFADTKLPRDRMPLVAFPGGYGGLVHTDRDRVSFSCCIRRDALAGVRAAHPGVGAGEAVLAHVLGSCDGAREALDGARRDGAWLAAGPLRPGIRSVCGDGYFAVGNALGEAHPIVAEGISMAIQSALQLAARLHGVSRTSDAVAWNAVAREYAAAYRAQFALRMRAASLFAAVSRRPRMAAAAAGTLAAVPALIGLGARCAGKAAALRAST